MAEDMQAFKDDSGKELTGRAKFHKEFKTR